RRTPWRTAAWDDPAVRGSAYATAYVVPADPRAFRLPGRAVDAPGTPRAARSASGPPVSRPPQSPRMHTLWDGITKPETLMPEAAALRHQLADAARAYDWPRVLGILAEHPEWVNASRPGGRSLFAPLHQAAHGGAPAAVVERLLALGAWRSLRD